MKQQLKEQGFDISKIDKQDIFKIFKTNESKSAHRIGFFLVEKLNAPPYFVKIQFEKENSEVEIIKENKINFFAFNLKESGACNTYLKLKKRKEIDCGIGFGILNKSIEKTNKLAIKLNLESYLDDFAYLNNNFVCELESLIEINKNMFKNQGFTILGQSGVGKNTLINNLLQYHKRAGLCTKITTRPLRKTDNRIRQVSEKEFIKLIKKKQLVGLNEYDNNLYGYLRNEIEAHIKFGLDMFIDTVVPDVATDLKKEFPGFFRTITLEKKNEQVTSNLINRFEKFDKQNSNLNYQRQSLNNRINKLIESDEEYNKMIEIADFVLKDDFFGFKNNEFRRYINYSRTVLFHPKNITLTDRYNKLYGRHK